MKIRSLILTLLLFVTLGAAGASAQDALPFDSLHYGSGSPSVAGWTPTAHITQIELRPDNVIVQFDRNNDTRTVPRWPDVTPPGWDGAIQYTLWPVININGEWWTFGSIELWRDRIGVGGPFSKAALDWYYPSSEMIAHQPLAGDQVGFFVTAGDQRLKDVHAVAERSYIVMLTVPRNDTGTFDFAAGPTPVPTPTPVPVPTPVPPAFDVHDILVRLDAIEIAVADLKTKVTDLLVAESIIDQRLTVLEARPIIASCSASVFGIPVSCRLGVK